MPELIDICFNFTHSSFRDDEQAVLERALDASVKLMMVTGSSVEESAECIALAERYPDRLNATVGVHPHMAQEWDDQTGAHLKQLADHPKALAIGEAGLDYNRDYSPRDAQLRAFEEQIQLACELKLPLFLHQRDAHADFIATLERYRADLGNVVVHCFTGNGDELDAFLALDLHVGITGWICDERRGHHLHPLIARIPADRLMIETDAPYLLPRDLTPKPTGRRNEPAFLPHILDTVARCLDLPPADVAAATTRTAKRFYGLD